LSYRKNISQCKSKYSKLNLAENNRGKQNEDEELMNTAIKIYDKMKELNDYINNRKIDCSYINTTRKYPFKQDNEHRLENENKPSSDKVIKPTHTDSSDCLVKTKYVSTSGESNWSTREGLSLNNSYRTQDDFISRSENWLKKKNEKVNRKRMTIKINELSNCTFHPSLTKKDHKRAILSARRVKRPSKDVTMLINMKFNEG